MTERTEIRKQEEFVRLDWRLTSRGQIPCKVFEGMFLTEKRVEVTIEEDVLVFYVDNEFVETDESIVEKERVNGWLKVKVKVEKANSLVIMFPEAELQSVETIEIPKEMIRGIKVPKNSIHPA